MRIVLGNWKYIIKNFWFVIPFAILPAIFLTLSIDYGAVGEVWGEFLDGDVQISFYMFFRAWSLIRIDGWLGAIYSLFAVLSCTLMMTVMLSLVEKHMRIGKRTLNGAFSQLGNKLLIAFIVMLVYVFLYELWAVIASAVMFMLGSLIASKAVAIVLMILFALLLVFVLVYCLSIFYLWFPCLQHTGFSFYEAFRYSYQLVLNVRKPLVIAFGCIYLIGCVIVGLCATFLPLYLFYPIVCVLFLFFFLDFCIRMETVYFKADRLDREDVKRYRGLNV